MEDNLIKDDILTRDFEEIIEQFSLKIKKSLVNTPYQEREDLEQEIKIKIYEKMDIINNITAPGFFEFINEEKKEK